MFLAQIELIKPISSLKIMLQSQMSLIPGNT